MITVPSSVLRVAAGSCLVHDITEEVICGSTGAATADVVRFRGGCCCTVESVLSALSVRPFVPSLPDAMLWHLNFPSTGLIGAANHLPMEPRCFRRDQG